MSRKSPSQSQNLNDTLDLMTLMTHLLKAIRNMEPAWVKVQGRKFALLQKTYNLPNGGTKMVPYYSLIKTECLYIATKFNDEARAKLVLRWETLERLNLLIKRLNRLFVGIDGCFKTVELTVCECDVLSRRSLESTRR